MVKLRVAVLCCDGRFQRYLVRRAAEEFDLVGVVWQVTPAVADGFGKRLRPYVNPLSLLRQIAARLLLPYFEHRAAHSLNRLFGADDPVVLNSCVVQVRVSNVNDLRAIEALQNTRPDIVLVNGTQLLREPLLSCATQTPLGCINLHTGLSPYSRGGNCNLFMLLESHPELMGVTIHHIDSGIDSGDIIRTQQLDCEKCDSFELLDARSFYQGIELLLQSTKAVHAGAALRVKQWADGKLFLRRTGYVYEPWYRLRANVLVASGSLRRYLRVADSSRKDVRLVGG